MWRLYLRGQCHDFAKLESAFIQLAKWIPTITFRVVTGPRLEFELFNTAGDKIGFMRKEGRDEKGSPVDRTLGKSDSNEGINKDSEASDSQKILP